MNPVLIASHHCRTTKTPTTRVFAIVVGIAVVILAGATTSCNTTRGFGQDVERTGDRIEHAASH